MELTVGTRMESATCDTQVVVVRAPKDHADVDLRCGGHPMREIGSSAERLEPTGESEPTLMGKRYADDDLGLELLCTRGGACGLTVGETPLPTKGAKPLPASD